MHEVPITGEGFRLTLRVGDYERAATGEGWDDNWLRGYAEMEIAQPPTATFRAQCDVAWQTTELHAFYEGLRTVLEDLTGTAKLTTIEDQVELTIELKSGKGTLTGRIEAHAIARSTSRPQLTSRFSPTRSARSGPSWRSTRIAADCSARRPRSSRN